ncbi:hypothetical protein TELCIR_00757 [Teladorsagia circumcincta]|uniref:Uncharacterized protein n=1 Tax=Teladorsagia circumcincta TaxID=45464 RepID=A0A2G9V3U2_TELCI|nr:hypothetical protein TELCIR_00757 [Teladorsagia circumcincta]
MSLRTLVFDTAQNSLVKIGTEVEQFVGLTDETQKSTDDDLATCITASLSGKVKTQGGSSEYSSAEKMQSQTSTEKTTKSSVPVRSPMKTTSAKSGSAEKNGKSGSWEKTGKSGSGEKTTSPTKKHIQQLL